MKYLVFILFFSCSLMDEPHFEVAPELAYYVNQFYVDAEDNKISIQRDRLIVSIEDKETIGLTKYGPINHVFIAPDVLQKDSLFIQYVVYHELGHALLYRDHCDDYSIMNPNKYVSDFRFSSDKRNELIKEMFR